MSKLAMLGGTPAVQEPLRVYRTIGNEEAAAVAKVMDSGMLSGFVGAFCPEFNGGEEVQALEKEWAEAFGVRHAVTVNSNTSGLIAALGALGLGPGDEVIVPPFSMSATAMAPLFYGGIPVFVDVEPNFFCLDANKVEDAITSRTRVILAVNLFGLPADLLRLRQLADKYGLFLVEDNAQSPLAKQGNLFAGTVGHVGVFSLNYHKHFHAGEGGICTTDDTRLADRMRMIRNHGENAADELGDGDYTNLIGFNFRMTELSAAIGREQLKKAPELVAKRVEIAERLTAQLSDLDGLTPPQVRESCTHVYYLWAAQYDESIVGVPREMFAKALAAEGVPNSVGYVKPLYLLPTFQRRIAIGPEGFPFTLSNITYPEGLCPVVERLYKSEILEYFICSYDPTDTQVEQIITAFRKVYAERKTLARASTA
jgi:perosamine synthetase